MPYAAPCPPATSPTWRNVRLDVLQKIEALPSLSSVVLEFLELTRREYFSARDFEAVLSKDQALVARLLKLANSGRYGGRRSVGTVPQAVVLVGLEEMKKIVLAASAAGVLRRSLRNYAYEPPQGFWIHSMGVGLAARCVTEAAGPGPLRGDETFVAGLLHDVGKLVLDDFLDPAAGPRAVTREEEVAAVGLDHSELGELILRSWHLPEAIVDAVQGHHRDHVDGTAARAAAPVRLAQALCSAWQVGQRHPVDLSEDVDLTAHEPLLELLGLPVVRLPQMIWDVRQNLAGLEERFNIGI